jgi:hypothetical protein
MGAVCECALSAFKETNSEIEATKLCLEKYKEGTLTPASDDLQVLYLTLINSAEKQEPERTAAPGLISMLGGGLAIVLGVAFFVAGLLGWLLVMKKRVLQCSVCGAVINAS